jgi:hypothetical protein
MGQLSKRKYTFRPTTVQMPNLALFETSSTSRLDLIHIRLDLIHIRLDLIHARLDLIHIRLDLIQSRNSPEGRQMKQW